MKELFKMKNIYETTTFPSSPVASRFTFHRWEIWWSNQLIIIIFIITVIMILVVTTLKAFKAALWLDVSSFIYIFSFLNKTLHRTALP